MYVSCNPIMSYYLCANLVVFYFLCKKFLHKKQSFYQKRLIYLRLAATSAVPPASSETKYRLIPLENKRARKRNIKEGLSNPLLGLGTERQGHVSAADCIAYRYRQRKAESYSRLISISVGYRKHSASPPFDSRSSPQDNSSWVQHGNHGIGGEDYYGRACASDAQHLRTGQEKVKTQKKLYSIPIRIVSRCETVHFAVPNGPFRSPKRSISQRQKGRFAKPVNIS